MDYVIPTTGWATITLPPYARYNVQGGYRESDYVRIDPSVMESMINKEPIVVPELAQGIIPGLLAMGIDISRTAVLRGFHYSPALLRPFTSSPVLIPESVILSLRETRKRSNKAFKALQESGKVVLNRMTTAELSCAPIIMPNSTDQLVQRFTVDVGLNQYELGQRRNLPNDYSYTWYDDAVGLPFKPPITTSGSKAMTDIGKIYGGKNFEHWRGNPTNSFAEYGKPDLQHFVDYLINLTPPVNLKTYALDEAYAGVYDAMTELVELPETLRYIYSLLERIIRLALSFKRKATLAEKKFTNKELIDEIASLWMQFRYAASPLAYSVQDAVELLFHKPQTYVTVRKRQDVPFRYEAGGHVIEGTAEHRCYVKIRLKQSSLNNIGLNPIKSLWEVTPLAFVIGWVLPIGSLLGSIMPPNRVDDIGVMESVRVRSITSNHHTMTCDFYHAQPTNAVPNGLCLDVHMNVKRYLDSLALSWGLFLKQHWRNTR